MRSRRVAAQRSINPTPNEDGPNSFRKVEDNETTSFDKIDISNNTIILMNTLNPMFVHRVNKLEHQNEVVLMTHYLWSKLESNN